jgi:hypothetical protein
MRSPSSSGRPQNRRSVCLWLAGLCLVAVAWAFGPGFTAPATACPFCSAPMLSLAEQIKDADAAAIARRVDGRPGSGADLGDTVFEIVDVLKGNVAVKDQLTLVRFRPAKSDERFLLLASRGTTGLDWGSPIEVHPESVDYLQHLPPPCDDEACQIERLKFFLQHLEHPVLMISDDAYAEFAKADYKHMLPLVSDFPKDKLRTWVTENKVAPSRLGLYGLMLGLSGGEAEAELLEGIILTDTKDFRLGIDGMMGGYLLLRGDAGLKVLEDTKLKNSKAPFGETYAAMQAIRFMKDFGLERIPLDRLKSAMHVLLDRPELADLVITDLARWKDWSVQDRLMEMYDQEAFSVGAIKRAIVKYMLAGTKDVQKNEAGEVIQPVPAHVTKAEQCLATLEQQDPMTVQQAKRFFFVR